MNEDETRLSALSQVLGQVYEILHRPRKPRSYVNLSFEFDPDEFAGMSEADQLALTQSMIASGQVRIE